MEERSEPRTTPRGQERRQAIVQAAIPAFAQQGYRGASLASIAAAVNMTQPGLLHHFPSKERLLQAVIDDLLAVLDERDHADCARLHEEFTSGGLATLDLLSALVEHNSSVRELVQLFTVLTGEAVSQDHPAHEHFAERYARVRRNLASDMRRGQDAGELRRDVDLEVIAQLLVAVLDGLQVQWLLDPEVDMQRAFDALADILRAYLTRSSA
jgi:AcrR family transcriptional regulator